MCLEGWEEMEELLTVKRELIPRWADDPLLKGGREGENRRDGENLGCECRVLAVFEL